MGKWRIDNAKSHFENLDLGSDLKLDITSEGGKYRLTFYMTDKNGKVEPFVMTQPKSGGKVSVENGTQTDVDAVTVEVADDHHWIYKYSKSGKVVFTRDVTLSADGKVHEAKSTRIQDGKKVVENEYMVKAK